MIDFRSLMQPHRIVMMLIFAGDRCLVRRLASVGLGTKIRTARPSGHLDDNLAAGRHSRSRFPTRSAAWIGTGGRALVSCGASKGVFVPSSAARRCCCNFGCCIMGLGRCSPNTHGYVHQSSGRI